MRAHAPEMADAGADYGDQFGKVLHSIWAPGSDFLMLTPDAQRMYLFLISQKEIRDEHTGVIPLRPGRWSGCAKGLTRVDVIAALTELEAGHYIVTDPDTDELLIRAYMRIAKVRQQPNLWRVIPGRCQSVMSAKIRQALIVELSRIDRAASNGSVSAVQGDLGLDVLPGGAGGGAGGDSRGSSPRASGGDAGGDPGGDPGGGSESAPGGGAGGLSLTLKSLTLLKFIPARARDDLGRDFDEFWRAWPRKKSKEPAIRAYAGARYGKNGPAASHAEIMAGVARYAAERAGQDQTYTAHAATWLNRRSWTDEPDGPPPGDDSGQTTGWSPL